MTLCAKYVLEGKWLGNIVAKPLPCRTWSCEDCQPVLRRRLIARIIRGKPNKMLTLTVRWREGMNAAVAYGDLHAAWRKLVKRICRLHGTKSLAYFAFVEQTKAGAPHLHVMLRCDYIKQKWLSEQMRDLIGAPVVDIRAVRDGPHAAFYVTKYVTKAPAQFGKSRRYWCSKAYAAGAELDDEAAWDPPFTAVTALRSTWEDYTKGKIWRGMYVADGRAAWHVFYDEARGADLAYDAMAPPGFKSKVENK